MSSEKRQKVVVSMEQKQSKTGKNLQKSCSFLKPIPGCENVNNGDIQEWIN
jgi:hypothetical protein